MTQTATRERDATHLSLVAGAMQIARAFGFFAFTLAWAGCGSETLGTVLWIPDASTPPEPVSLLGQSSTMEHGGSGGVPYADTCRNDQAVTGYAGSLATATVLVSSNGTTVTVQTLIIGSIQTVCGALTVGADGRLLTSPGDALAVRGTEPDAGQADGGPPMSWLEVCPDNEVVIGFSGRTGDYVDQLVFICAEWTFSRIDGGSAGEEEGADGAGGAGEDGAADEGGNPSSGWSLGEMTTLPQAGGQGGSSFTPEMCPPGQMALGSEVHSGVVVDAFGLLCGTPSVNDDGGI